MRDGKCFPLANSERHTHGKGCSQFPTPNAIDGEPVAALWDGHGEIYKTKNGTLRRRAKTGSNFGVKLPVAIGGTPNPMWVEWLMGWPMGWTALEPLATDKFQLWLQLHGRY